MDLCLYLPEDLAKIKSVEVLASKRNVLGRLTKKGEIWEGSITFPDNDGRLVYYYKVSIKISGFLYNKTNEIVDKYPRYVARNAVQRDILSIESTTFKEKDMSTGLMTHVLQILKSESFDSGTAFHDLDNLQVRNNLKMSHWLAAFKELFSRQDITRNVEICLLLLHSIHKTYLCDSSFIKADIACRLWENFQKLDKDSSGMCIENAGHIFDIYRKANNRCSPVHFINGMQSLLDISALHGVLTAYQPPATPVPCCSNSLSCLQCALQFLLSVESESQKLHDIVCVIFENIAENEILEGFLIIQDFNLLHEVGDEIRENVQKYVLEKAKKTISVHLKGSKFSTVTNMMAKTKDELRCHLVAHCQEEILSDFARTVGIGHGSQFFKELENFCLEQNLFPTESEKVHLLDTVLKRCMFQKPRDFIKFVLMNCESAESEGAKQTLERGYESLLDTVEGFWTENIKQIFREYDALSKKKYFKGILQNSQKMLLSKISKMETTYLLKVNADIDSLDENTSNLYCQVLKERIVKEDLSAKLRYVQPHYQKVETR